MPANDLKQVSPLMTRRLIWFSMFQGVLLICGIFIYMGIKAHSAPPAHFEWIKYIFLLISVTVILSSKTIKNALDRSASTPSTGNPKVAGSRSNAGFFVVMAICEGSAMIGLVLAYLSGDLNNLYTLAAPGVIGMAMNFPREEYHD